MIFPISVRILHWLRALAIVALALTGAYIAWPMFERPDDTNTLVQGWVRYLHLLTGFVFIGVTLVRGYLFLFTKETRERASFRDVFSLKSWIIQIKSYFWRGHLDKAGIYGPLQLTVYFGITVLAILASISGLVLYAYVYHHGLGGALRPMADMVVHFMGGLARVRYWHHVFAWAFVIFIPIHIYMVVWTGIRFKHNSVEVIITGYDYHKQPVKKG
ncbi:Ni/Fe-hydrogenase, b-type cytochrome subunit [Sansalvadorimonas verongulae]|nr:Ni/Fe-hydrogenase, b-type cytochrome subunit [Sansalvadorimonas verongulae]